MLRQCPMPDRKLFANSFLPPCSTTVPRRMGNYPQTVSFRYESHCSQVGQETFRKQFPSAMLHQWSQVGQETIREQFPVTMLHHCLMPNKKLSVNSLLSPCSTTAPCRTRNYPPIVSCRHAPPLSHAGQETISEQFPAAMLHHCPMPHRKLFASSFLSSCSATAPHRMGSHRKKTVKK